MLFYRVVEVGVIQRQHELLGLRFIRGDLSGEERESERQEEADRNLIRHRFSFASASSEKRPFLGFEDVKEWERLM